MEDNNLDNEKKILNADELDDISGGAGAKFGNCPKCGAELRVRSIEYARISSTATIPIYHKTCPNCGYEN